MADHCALTVSAIVVTFGRHEVLVETLERLLRLAEPADEIVVVDQTPEHPPAVALRLRRWSEQGEVRHLSRAQPSIPGAMNDGLLAASSELVLFVDDDVEPLGELIAAHRRAHAESAVDIVAGQILQPGEISEPLAGERFAFRSSRPQAVDRFMGGNFSVARRAALSIGGFDENFRGAAYRYEADFAARARAAGLGIRFEPAASLRHLRAPSGGTRSFGDHLRTARPDHAVGEYYHLLRNRPPGAWRRLLARPWRAVLTRHHLVRPWWIPATLVGELAGLAWAARLALAGPRLIQPPARAPWRAA